MQLNLNNTNPMIKRITPLHQIKITPQIVTDNHEDDEIFAGLNPEQRKVVAHINGPALISAGAGSGKTFCLVRRTQNMIKHGIHPSNIVLITFTKKAANEIKSRIVNAIGENASEITAGTFHSICNKILREFGELLGYNKYFTILDDDGTDKILKSISKDYGVDNKALKAYIDKNKARCKTPITAYKDAETDLDRTMAECYTVYQNELKREQCMDFADLILNTVILLEKEPEVKKLINDRWKYISVDESQDTSELDSKLIQLLAGKNQNVAFIGDDWQSIYAFRHANIDIILNLEKQYPTIKKYTLGTNYRSSKTIIEAGANIISNNKKQLKKNTNCGRVENGKEVKGEPIIFNQCKDSADQSSKIVTYINMFHNKLGLQYKDIAILFRMTHLSASIEEALMKARIPYKIVGGISFFNRMEIQDVLAFARLTVNPHDIQAFKRTISIPKRGIGDKTIEKIDMFSLTNKLSIREAITHPDLELKGKAKKSLKEYVAILERFDSYKEDFSTADFLEKIIGELYFDYIKNECKENQEEFQERIENLQELINVAKEYETIEDLIEEALLYKEEGEEEEDCVQLMTMHKSKGLEFKAVLITDMSEGTAPHFKALEDYKQMEEERRLAYVGVTRAKDYLVLLQPKYQMLRGQMTFTKPSRFIDEIGNHLMYRR